MSDATNETPDDIDERIARAERLEKPDEPDDGLNWHVALGVLVAAVALGYLVFDGLGSETYFFTVEEAVAQSTDLVGHEMRVKGTVVEGSIRGEEGEIGRKFRISKSGKTMHVTYDKAMPDTFKPGVEVVATGTLSSPNKLEAHKVLVKCPSRYEGSPPTEHEGESGRPTS